MPTSDILSRALTAFQSQRWDAAERSFKKFLRSEPKHFGALNLYSVLLLQRGQFAEAAKQLQQAISVDPRSDQTFYNYGIALKNLKRHEEAAASFTKSIELDPNVAETWNNRGTTFKDLKRYQAAVADFDRAIALSANYADAFYNKGNSLRMLGELDSAVAAFHRAVQIRPNFCEAWEEIAFIRGSQKDHPAAIAACEKALAIDPSLTFAKALRVLSSANLCDWKHYEADTEDLIARIGSQRSAIRLPSVYLTLPSSARHQLLTATSFSHEYFEDDASPLSSVHPSTDDRIRVAYISSDFREHPTAYLITGVFEHHDRSRFEIIGISTAPEASGSMAERIKQAVDKFYDVSSISDDEVAALLRQLRIDIAVDLNGYTQGMRLGLFAKRPAPVHVNYIGYPATMGSRHIDYIIADKTVIPPGEDSLYSEKIVRLPDMYQPNDDKRPCPDCSRVRADFGLPPEGVVFCCFNNTYKITPDIFDIWTRLLNQVEGSVLWLLEGNTSTKSNLLKEAETRGISSDRLVFAPRVNYAEYLARYRLADLFLDTPYYNAGATASDALWMGLPVVTREGQTFASRMASSLLRAIDAPELITMSLEDYEALALNLARDPVLLAAIKEKLERNRNTTTLFDTKGYTRNLEGAYQVMRERTRRGEPPVSFAIEG